MTDPWSLTAAALREPWRLWTAHAAHFGAVHAAANALAVLVPAILVPREDRRRMLLVALVVAPLLSLLLLPGLGEGRYRGASGLGCALWAFAGLRLALPPGGRVVGLLLLGALGAKIVVEVLLDLHPVAAGGGWVPMPRAHVLGALLGLAAALRHGPRGRVPTGPS
jgi:membrane associated rhomboid family serine protease